MKKAIKEISVFLPAYNEEENIEKTVSNVKKVLVKVADKWEILVINDGSSDNTAAASQAVAKTDKRIKVITHKKNKGYGGALKTGYKHSKYEWVAFIDSDGQFDFSEIKKFIPEMKDNDMVLGNRIKRADSLLREVFTFGWSLLARIILGLKEKDYSCGFWLVRNKAYKGLLPLVGEEKVTKIEMLVKAHKKGYKIAEVGVNHYPRTAGTQTGADLKVVIKSVLDLIKLRKILK